MKKTILFILLFCGITLLGNAQLTLSNYPTRTFTALGGTPNSYTSTFHNITLTIAKLNGENRWSIYQGDVETPTILYYSSDNTSNEPPCNDTWKIPNGGFLAITMTGSTCIQLPIRLADIITPSTLQLPNLSSNMILAIPNPKAGMITWDISNNCRKVYNGTSWNCQ